MAGWNASNDEGATEDSQQEELVSTPFTSLLLFAERVNALL